MAALKKHKTHGGFSGSVELIEVEYDFAKDGGATGALDILTVTEDCVLIDAYLKVDASVTSDGSATLIYGVQGGDTDACLDVTSGAKANLVAGAVIPGEAACKQIKLEADDVLEMTIGTAALTAGKCRFVFMIQKF